MRGLVNLVLASGCLVEYLRGTCGFMTTPVLARRHSSVSGHTRKPSPVRRGARPALLSMMAEEFDSKENIKIAEERMDKSVQNVQSNMDTIRTGRASPKILDRVVVACYGAETPLNQVASVKTSSATQLVVEAYDSSILADIADAIQQSDVGITPSNDGSVIRLNMPPVTEDRRKELAKEAKALGEEGKVAIRNIRREAVDSVKKAEKSKSLGKDQAKDAQDAIQKLTDKCSKAIDGIVSQKEKDILKV